MQAGYVGLLVAALGGAASGFERQWSGVQRIRARGSAGFARSPCLAGRPACAAGSRPVASPYWPLSSLRAASGSALDCLYVSPGIAFGTKSTIRPACTSHRMRSRPTNLYCSSCGSGGNSARRHGGITGIDRPAG